MKLSQFFRFSTGLLFQSMKEYHVKPEYKGYENQLFFLPKLICEDGFTISCQIHNGNYCSSENGYRTFGWDWKEVEFGYPSMNEPLLWIYSEMYNGDLDLTDLQKSYISDLSIPVIGREQYFGIKESDFNHLFGVTETVGIIPVEVLEKIVQKHGGVNWEKTTSKENMSNLYR